MKRRTIAFGCGAVLYSLGACADATAPHHAAPAALDRQPTEAELAELGPEFQASAIIERIYVWAGFRPGRAEGFALMDYFANWAKLTLTLTVLRDGRQVTATTAMEVRSDILPGVRTIVANAELPVASECGHTAIANATGEVRQEALIKLSILRWGERASSNSASADQPHCPSSCSMPPGDQGTPPAMSEIPAGVSLQCTGTGTGGGGAGGAWIAVTTTTCYGYHYYDGSGRYLYSVITHCDTTTSYYYQLM